MTFNVRSGRMLQHLRRDRVYAYHASVALLGMIGREEYGTLFENAFRLGHGYWMNNINALLDGDPESCESPGRQGISPEEAIGIIKRANNETGPTISEGAQKCFALDTLWPQLQEHRNPPQSSPRLKHAGTCFAHRGGIRPPENLT